MKKTLLLGLALLSLVTVPLVANASRVNFNFSFVELQPEPNYMVVERTRIIRPQRYYQPPHHHHRFYSRRHRAHYAEAPREYYDVTTYSYSEPYYYAPRYDVYPRDYYEGEYWGW